MQLAPQWDTIQREGRGQAGHLRVRAGGGGAAAVVRGRNEGAASEPEPFR
jgi:hypothetical protein